MKRSQTILRLANLASKGRYDNVTPAAAREMNQLFEDVAVIINQMEEEEKEQDNE